ncbi:MIP/aquaporin family protein [Clostridium thailandense]|uniref:Aquaporin family protein n=1 Tax=Clostridium thailandense TaxID=2794346 RepID=A0A949WR09_9CLOT|nr:MIP/aquaporin family protein [Clostridium thailandense]MBV7273440.1 aquaporin family protein [Clostridium thailandense]
MAHYMGELFGTMFLIYLGDGCVANISLNKSKAQGAGWLTVNIGFALAVGIPVYIFGPLSGAHFNPAVTLGLAMIGKFPWEQVPMYIACQMIGCFIGAALVWIQFYPHWGVTEDKATKLGVFCTGPAIRNVGANFISEFLGTFVLMFAILGVGNTKAADPAFGALIVALIICVLGTGIGGTTGYALNPARDLGPRIAHAVLPIAGKGDSDWGYSWIPVVAPICGGIAAALAFSMMF